jgi:hypothetical protein
VTVVASARGKVAGSAQLVFGAAIGIVLLLSLLEIYRLLTTAIPDWWQADWRNLVAAASADDPYAAAEGYRWSPVAAWLLKPVVTLGWMPFIAAHFAALLFIRDPRIVALMLVWWPFWNDVLWGNVVTFAFVAAWLAVAGSRVATVVFYVFAILMPRPLMLPIALWLLWKRPESRAWFAAVFGVHLGLVLASGLGDEWIARLLVTPATEMLHPANFAPTRLLGWIWIPIGAVLAMWLTLKGRLGMASVAVQPYLFPNYMMFALIELRPRASEALDHEPHAIPSLRWATRLARRVRFLGRASSGAASTT